MKRLYLIIALLILFAALCVACVRNDDTPDGTTQGSDSTSETQPTTTASSTASLSATETTALPTTVTPTATVPVTTTVPATSTTATTTPSIPVTTTPVTTTSVTTVPVTTTAPVTTAPVTTKQPSTLVIPEIVPDDDELVKVSDHIPSLYVDLRYAGDNNLAGMPIYDYTDAYLRYGSVKRLAAVQEELLEEGYSLLIWDAYRPLSAQFSLSTVLPEKATSPIVKTIPYNAGDTLSVSIVSADGSPVPIPYDFDYSALTDTHDDSAAAKANADRLADAMHHHGFNDYLSQWYRFTDVDDYSIPYTLTIGEAGIESAPEWVTVCDSTLTLRSEPSTTADAIAKLPRGKKVKVIYFTASYAYIEADGKRGYVLAAYLSRSEDGLYRDDLEVIEITEAYDYTQMQADLAALAEKFPDQLRLSSIGKSEEGRELTLAILGNENAEKRVFLQSTIHAREYIVTELTLAQIDYMLHHQDEYLPNSTMTIGELLEKVCFHIVPMSNPDGVEIVKSGKLPEPFADRISDEYATIWKANAEGIDLNANFDADWEDYDSAAHATEPGYMGYKGTAPESAAESKALADYLRQNAFDLILSYHTSGSIIYWSYGGEECKAVNNLNYSLACKLAVISDFTVNQQVSSSTAGLKDWAIQSLKTPSLTIEFASADSPVMLREFDQIWARGRDMLALCGEWVLGG